MLGNIFIQKEEFMEVVELARAGVDPSLKCGNGDTLLARVTQEIGEFHGVENPAVEVIERLLDWGADPNERCEDGDLPLHRAAEVGGLRAVELLLAAGADPNKGATHGETALMRACGAGEIKVMEALWDRTDRSLECDRGLDIFGWALNAGALWTALWMLEKEKPSRGMEAIQTKSGWKEDVVVDALCLCNGREQEWERLLELRGGWIAPESESERSKAMESWAIGLAMSAEADDVEAVRRVSQWLEAGSSAEWMRGVWERALEKTSQDGRSEKASVWMKERLRASLEREELERSARKAPGRSPGARI